MKSDHCWAQILALKGEIERLKAQFDAARAARDILPILDTALAETVKDERIAALTALLEKVPHDGNEAGCFKTCPACAFERMRKEWEK